MFSRRPVWLILAALFAAMSLRAEEQNAWPLAVRQLGPDGTLESDQCLGPFLFTQRTATGEVQGFRPLFLQTRAGDHESNSFLYPLFTWERQPGSRTFSFFQLVNHRQTTEPGQPEMRGFDVWPLYFSRETGDPATTYHALFPVAGTITQRFGKDRLTWYAFPLYFHTDKAGLQVTTAPWPFLRFIDGAGHHGFEFWPLFGHRARAGDYDDCFWLWPLGYKQATHLSEPQPTVRRGALPFYASDTGPGYRSETYVWPFFGYTHRTEPDRYDEQRYLWPFLVQGRGNQRYVNRWAPLYTHSTIKGYDKTWIVWPLFRHARWTESGLIQEQNQVCWFFYWSLTQSSATNPAAASAHKTHLWPLFSSWDNGAGRRQLQLLSPLEVFFPTNEPVRQLYSPLFAIYRYEQRAPGDTRGSVLFNLLSWRKSPTGREFHLGPVFSVKTDGERQRVALGNGLIGLQRRSGEHAWRLFLFDFARKPATKANAAPPP